MPRDIVSSEPRHWMVFGQLVMPVQCCARHGGGGCLNTALHRHNQLAKYHLVPWLRWHNVSWHQVFRLPEGWASIFPEIWSSDEVLNIKFMRIIKFDLKWVHMARYELILRLDGALWLTIISKTPLTPRKAMEGPKNPKESKKCLT